MTNFRQNSFDVPCFGRREGFICIKYDIDDAISETGR